MRPPQVPPSATRVTRGDAFGIADRYGVIGSLLEAGVEAARIEVFYDPEVGGTYWVVALDGGRAAVLTDDTEEHVGHVEGPWPFKAVFLGPDGVRTEIDYSIGDMKARLVTWCAAAMGDGATAVDVPDPRPSGA
ncbi:hypothetical protein [Streptomyces sp. NPDC005017]|uniref:hypothetical protein n=1 Tax=Streptomyces sp. NPDC005017 TaxID=3364706 RepID=UPI003680AC74